MKTVLTISFLFSIYFQNLNAQIWVKNNATWHYSWSNLVSGGFLIVKNTGDTTILGEVAKKYVSKLYLFTGPPTGPYIFQDSSIYRRDYAYTNGNKVYYWQDTEWRKMLDFDATAGSNWLLAYDLASVGVCNDSTILNITSTALENINGTNYSAVTTSCNDGNRYLNGFYNARFGSSTEFVFPRQSWCAGPGIPDESPQISFRCFSDDSLSYNATNTACEIEWQLALEEFNTSMFTIHPNPSTGIFTFDAEKLELISITNSVGQEVQFYVSDGEVVLEHSSPEIYSVLFEAKNGQVLVKRLVVR